MQRLFLDANILFSASYSSSGASRALFELAKHKKLKLVSSLYAIKEAQTNIERKLGENSLPQFLNLISLLSEVDKESSRPKLLKKFKGLINKKDMPILISAASMNADFLITLDRKDFMTKKLSSTDLPFKIVLPGKYLQSL